MCVCVCVCVCVEKGVGVGGRVNPKLNEKMVHSWKCELSN